MSDLSQHSHRCSIFGSLYGLSGQGAQIRLSQFHLVKCKILTNDITPHIAGVDQRGTRVIIYTNWKVLTETIATFVVIIYRRDVC
jgi:hypothetical protein